MKTASASCSISPTGFWSSTTRGARRPGVLRVRGRRPDHGGHRARRPGRLTVSPGLRATTRRAIRHRGTLPRGRPARPCPASTPGVLPSGGRVSGEIVRVEGRRRDLPHLGHHPARRGPDRGRRPDPDASFRAHHVHRRRLRLRARRARRLDHGSHRLRAAGRGMQAGGMPGAGSPCRKGCSISTARTRSVALTPSRGRPLRRRGSAGRSEDEWWRGADPQLARRCKPSCRSSSAGAARGPRGDRP